MPKCFRLLFFALPLVCAYSSFSQDIVSCSDFSITAVSPDTLNAGDFLISIQSQSAANTIINYPKVAAVINGQGDTVATGDLFFFGQLGETTQDYPVTVTGALTIFPLTVIFTYGTTAGDDTCVLSFGTSSLFESEKSAPLLSVFPNPTSVSLHIHAPDHPWGFRFFIRDIHGKTLMMRDVPSAEDVIDLSGLPKGIYSVHLANSFSSARRFVIE